MVMPETQKPGRTRRPDGKTDYMDEVAEQLGGGNIEDLLVEAYNRLGTLKAIVEEWNSKLDGKRVSEPLLSMWMVRLQVNIVKKAERG